MLSSVAFITTHFKEVEWHMVLILYFVFSFKKKCFKVVYKVVRSIVTFLNFVLP